MADIYGVAVALERIADELARANRLKARELLSGPRATRWEIERTWDGKEAQEAT